MSPTTNTGKMKKTKTRKKDSQNKPKRPMSAYNFFFKDERARIAAASDKVGKNPEDQKTFEDTGRVIGKRWREISDDQLERYQKLASADSIRYKREMKKFYDDELKLMCSGVTNGAGVVLPKAPVQQISVPSKEPDSAVASSQGQDACAAMAMPQAATSSFPGSNESAAEAALLQNQNSHLRELAKNQQNMMNNNFIQTAAFALGLPGPLPTQQHQHLNNLIGSNHAGPTDGLAALLLAHQGTESRSLSTPQQHVAPNADWNTGFHSLISNNARSPGQFPSWAYAPMPNAESVFNNNDLSQLLLRQLQSSSATPASDSQRLKYLLDEVQKLQNELVQQRLTQELGSSLFQHRSLERILADHQASCLQSFASAQDDRKPAATSMPSQGMPMADILNAARIMQNNRQEGMFHAAQRETSNAPQPLSSQMQATLAALQQLLNTPK